MAIALLLYGSHGKHTQQAMLNYGIKFNQWCRTNLFKQFLFYEDKEFSLSDCICYDICESKCKCTDCISK